MAPNPNLENQLQSARLEAIIPVLAELGVECCEDLEFIEDHDIDDRKDITLIHKRRFFEWRAKVLEIPNLDVASTACSSESSRRHLGSPMGVPQLDLPSQTPRTRARPLVQVLQELQLLDDALQEERDRSSDLMAELQEERRKHAAVVAELEEARRHSKELAKEVVHARNMAGNENSNSTEELQAERKNSSRIIEEKKANEESHARDIAVLEEMLEHLIKDNAALKQKLAASGPSSATSPRAPQVPVPQFPRVPECHKSLRNVCEPEQLIDDFTTHGRDMFGGRMSAACEPEIRSSARNSAAYEPEMEPRRTFADRLSHIQT
jgi:DNA repair exonuclease SbcCD ATPase subunit